MPAVDPSVDPSSLLNLALSNYATLYYAQPSPGTTVIEVEYHMTYPQVTLENSNQLDTVLCNGNTIILTMASLGPFQVVSLWPESNFVLITNSHGCNPATQRGVYLVTSFASDNTTLTATFQVTPQTWTDVAQTMEISYGTSAAGANANVPYTPSCTGAYSSPTSSASSSPTSTSLAISYADLTPEEKALVAWLTRNNTYDANGNIAVSMPNATQQTATPSPYNPNPDPAQQAASEAALEAAGLPSPGSMFNTTQAAIGGHCSNGLYVPPTSKRSLIFSQVAARQPRASPSTIKKRDDNIDDETWWTYLWDVGCDDLVDEIIDALNEEVGAIIELICALKEIYDDVREAYDERAAIQCVLDSCYIDAPTSKYWDYTYSWDADFDVPAQPLVAGATGTVSCVDCSLSVSEVQFQGRVMVSLVSGEVQAAYMSPTVSWSANLVMGLSSTGPFSGSWDYSFPTLAFPGPVTVPGEFTIS